MSDRDKLANMHACKYGLDWIGDRTIEQAWGECKRLDWMCWLLQRLTPNDPRCRLAAADFAERVWHLIGDEPTKLAAAWAIGAARRGDVDEREAAAAAASYAADVPDADALDADAPYGAAYTAYTAHTASYAASYAAYAETYAAARAAARAVDAKAEHAAQVDILREYFPAGEIATLFNNWR